MVGSHLIMAKKETAIFGAGFIDFKQMTISENIYYVRGKLSRVICELKYKKPIEIFEPAFCLLNYFNNIKPIREVGVFPHYIDTELKYNDSHVYSVCEGVETVTDNILSCKNIITSSLHVYIVARLFGRGAAFIPCKNIIGNEFKVCDYLSYFDISFNEIQITQENTIERELIKTFNNPLKPEQQEINKYLTDLKKWCNDFQMRHDYKKDC